MKTNRHGGFCCRAQYARTGPPRLASRPRPASWCYLFARDVSGDALLSLARVVAQHEVEYSLGRLELLARRYPSILTPELLAGSALGGDDLRARGARRLPQLP